MYKKTSFTAQGRRADIGVYRIDRLLPNKYSNAIGPFVFLDHGLPIEHKPGSPYKAPDGSGAHPHRGIATLTYVLEGKGEHYDSNGNHEFVSAGGAQWMKAGSGVIHDEVVNADTENGGLSTHILQFWINLPAKQKAESPEYLAIQGSEVPQEVLNHHSGWIKVIVGNYENLDSKIPNYSKQFLYHIYIEPGKIFSLETGNEDEYAVFLPLQNATVNMNEHQAGTLLGFDQAEGLIEIRNTSEDSGLDVIIFGGEKYTESIIATGPFVMNSQKEIARAYHDFHEGNYGKIVYD